MEKRRFDIDNLKGILIFLVVFSHLLIPVSLKNEGYCYKIFSFIYFFHMPLFLFTSGLITSNNNIKNSIKKYILLYFLFNFSYSIFDNFLNGTEISFITPYYSMWFLLAVIFCKCLVYSCQNKLLLIFSIILSVCVGFSNIDNTFALARMISFLPFFLIGNYFKDFLFNFKDNKLKNKFFFNLFSCFWILSFIFYFTKTTNLSLDFYSMSSFSNNIDFICRIIFVFINILLCFFAFFTIPNKKLLFISNIGKNSLNIYLLHRFVTLIFEKVFIEDKTRVIISVILAILICFVLGSEIFNKLFEKFINFSLRKQIYIYFFLGLFLVTFTVGDEQKNNLDTNLLAITNKIDNLDNCIKISYIGDFLLFEDEILKAKKDDTYDFINYFKYTKDYFGDYTFGVLEGPVSNNYFSTGNYNDYKKVSLNYPEEFLEEISKNIDFVTIGTNHLLDRGKDGLIQTIDNLNKYNLDYTGGYLSKEENERVKIINIEGIKFAVLSYVYGINETNELESFMYNSFNEEEIKEDILRAKELGVDKIIAMTHLGTQFSHEINYEQHYYNNLLANNGVDIILSDHAHATQPIQFLNNTVIFNCPGNYVSSYNEYDGGYSSICNIYIDKNSKKVITTSIVPLVAKKDVEDITIPVPTYLLNDITGSNIVTKSMIDKEFHYVQKEIFYNKNGFAVLNTQKTLEEDGEIFEYIGDDSICFIGDSVTEGTNNGFIGWYEAINIDNEIHNISRGGATSSSILELIKQDEKAKDFDCYIIAIGTNDIRYFNLNEKEFLNNLNKIIDYLGTNKKYIFLSPWYFLNSDLISIINISDKDNALEKYNTALLKFCNENRYLHVNQNIYLKEFFEENLSGLYLNDFIHPTNIGVEIYSKAFLLGDNNFRKVN